MSTTILYHKNCNDGLIAAMNFYAYFKEKHELDNVIFQPVQHGEPLPDQSILKDREVYVVDFSYPRTVMMELVEMASNVTLLDHHESAIHNLFTGEKWLSGCNLPAYKDEENGEYLMTSLKAKIEVDKKRSGATLAYREVGVWINDPVVQQTLHYISTRAEDRDNWVFDYEDSKAVHEYIRSIGFDLSKLYDALFGNGIDFAGIQARIKEAQIRVDMRDELARNYARLARPVNFMGHTVPAVNIPSDFASLVGDILNKNAPFAVMYVVTDQKILLSMRSDKDKGVDVEEIARQLGGGGHSAASGCSIPHTELASFLKGHIQPGWL